VRVEGRGDLKGGFHKSWAHGVERKAHPNLGENVMLGVRRKYMMLNHLKKMGANFKGRAKIAL
jgi:hypothetical protein